MGGSLYAVRSERHMAHADMFRAQTEAINWATAAGGVRRLLVRDNGYWQPLAAGIGIIMGTMRLLSLGGQFGFAIEL
jgi:hypothetical protein